MNMTHQTEVKKLQGHLKKCQLVEPAPISSKGTVLKKDLDPVLVSKWPKLKLKVPAIFLHKPEGFDEHAVKLLNLGVNFFRPSLGPYHTKINSPTHTDQRAIAKYFDKNHLPYHTYGHPTKRKLKVVIRGLPNDTQLKMVKEEIKRVDIPLVRLHKMHTKEGGQFLVLVVVPYTDEGKRIFLLQKLLGFDIQLEPPKAKAQQCHRCQKWGHSQRYCHGAVKCVKCAGDHFSNKCTRDPEKQPPKCANCGLEHTANYTGCSHCPTSDAHKRTIALKSQAIKGTAGPEIPKLVTFENIDKLYRNIGYLPKCDDIGILDFDSDDYEDYENYEIEFC